MLRNAKGKPVSFKSLREFMVAYKWMRGWK
jgi:hypothetical protein